MAMWRFQQRSREAKKRNPPLEWFFNLDVMEHAGEPLVREGIQNSLDARASDAPIRIRIYLSDESGSMPATQMAPFLSGLEPHLTAAGNGLKAPPDTSSPCPYLVFEDFGTTGLEGNPEQDSLAEGEDNAFYHFFRAEGSSTKGEGKLGKFGIGKFAFPLCSRVRAVLALTRRSDERELMAGIATLKCHTIDGNAFHPDGWFGRFADDNFQLPVEDAEALGDFRRAFGLEREEEPGLSLVVPYYRPDQVTAPEITKAVLRHFFLPVVNGDLSVRVTTPEEEQEVSSTSIPTVMAWLRAKLGNKEAQAQDLADLEAIVSIAKASVAYGVPDVEIAPPDAGGALKWKRGCLAQGTRNELARKLRDGQILVARLHLHVLPKSKKPTAAYFDVFLQENSQGGYAKPEFVRKGNVIAAVGRRIKGYRAIVSIPDNPLSDALGKAENVAHTEWRRDSEDFKSSYTYAASHIEYVERAVSNLLGEIYATEEEVDFNALAEVFPDFESKDDGLGKKPKLKKGKRKVVKPPPPPPPGRKRIKLQQVAGGFSILRGDPEAPIPSKITVRIAYRTRRGNPFKKYDPADFNLTKKGLSVEANGASVEAAGPNVLQVSEIQEGFSVTVRGFDQNRDLSVDPRAFD